MRISNYYLPFSSYLNLQDASKWQSPLGWWFKLTMTWGMTSEARATRHRPKIAHVPRLATSNNRGKQSSHDPQIHLQLSAFICNYTELLHAKMKRILLLCFLHGFKASRCFHVRSFNPDFG